MLNNQNTRRYRDQRYVCECGLSVCKYNKSIHEKSKRHNNLINKDKIIIIDDKKYMCKCGIISTKAKKKRHERSKQHNEIIKNKNINDDIIYTDNMADKTPYCGIKKLTKKQRRGTVDECTASRQIRYWGIEPINKKEEKKDKPKHKPKPPPPKKKAPKLKKDKPKPKKEKEEKMSKGDKERMKLMVKVSGLKGSIKKFQVQYNRAKHKYDKDGDDEWKEKMDSYKKSLDKNRKELDTLLKKTPMKKTKGDNVTPKPRPPPPKKKAPVLKKEKPKPPPKKTKKECNIRLADFNDVEKLKNIKFPCTIGKGKTEYHTYDQLKDYIDTKIKMSKLMKDKGSEKIFNKMRSNIVAADLDEPPPLQLEPEEVELQRGIINMYESVDEYENVYLQLDFDNFEQADKAFYGFIVRDKKTSPFVIINEMKPKDRELLKKGQLEGLLSTSQECKMYSQLINSLYKARKFLIKNGASADKLKLDAPSKALDAYLKKKCKNYNNPFKK